MVEGPQAGGEKLGHESERMTRIVGNEAIHADLDQRNDLRLGVHATTGIILVRWHAPARDDSFSPNVPAVSRVDELGAERAEVERECVDAYSQQA